MSEKSLAALRMGAAMTQTLLCPFESRSSPLRDRVESHNLAWLEGHGLLDTPRARQTAERARFAWLAARAYPDATFDGLRLATAWASWLFLRDDFVDQRA